MLFDILKNRLILNYLPYFGSILIFLGVIRQIFYYAGFGISIVNYLDFSEIITSFLDLLVLMVLSALFMIFQSFLNLGNSEISYKNEIKEELLKQNRSISGVILYLKFFKQDLILISIVFLINFLYNFYYYDVEIIGVIGWIIFIVFMLILIVLPIEFQRKHEKFKTTPYYRKLIRIVSNSLIVIFLVIFYSIYQIYNIKINHSTEGSIIVLNNNKTLKSNKEIYFIGKSNNYIFIHNSKENATTVIPINRVKEISFKSKNRYFFF